MTPPAQLRMASVPLKFFPWLVCSVHITSDLSIPPTPFWDSSCLVLLPSLRACAQ